MSVILKSGTTADLATIDPVTKGVRVGVREPDTTGGGLFAISLRTGATTGLSATNPILSFRWSSSSVIASLQYLAMSGVITTANGATAGVGAYEAVIARSFSASDTGGTAVTVGALQKKRTSYVTSVIGDLRVATTGTLTAGTRTLDTSPFVSAQGGIIATAAIGVNVLTGNVVMFDSNGDQKGGIIFAQNEGFIVRAAAAYPATVAITLQIDIAWREATAI